MCFSIIAVGVVVTAQLSTPVQHDMSWRRVLDVPVAFDTSWFLGSPFGCVFPRTAERFIPMRGERLGDRVVLHSQSWMRMFFRDEANPHKAGEVSRGYFLVPPDQWGDTLQFVWKSPRYSFEVQESNRAILLLVTPTAVPFDPATGVPAAAVAKVMGDVLGPGVAALGAYADQFKLPAVCRAGDIYDNKEAFRKVPVPKSDTEPIATGPHWYPIASCVVTPRGVAFVVVKCNPHNPRWEPGLPQETWLRASLFRPDGTLVPPPGGR